MDIGQAIQPGKQNPLAGIFSGLSTLLGIGSKEGQQATATPENKERDPAIAAMSTAKPQDTPPPVASKSETQPNENQGLLMKAIESIVNAFGMKMEDLTRLLLKANPLVAQEAVASALQAVLPQQAVTTDPLGASIKAVLSGQPAPEAFAKLQTEAQATANTQPLTTLTI